jgi:acyl-CoA dehydrogenase
MNAQAQGSQTIPDIDGIRSATDAVAAMAAAHAVAVDRDSRFPHEAIAAAKLHRLLGIQVPRRLGGKGAPLSEIVQVCYRLGRVCASTAMIFAMHQIKIACILRHSQGSAWHELMLQRLCAEQLLLASSTTEGTGGGNVRSSEAPVEHEGSRITLLRRATVMSYGAEADGIVTTARRSADAAASDQVLIVFLKSDYALEPLVSWDTLGMRGTSSTGYVIRASGEAQQILPDAYEKIHVETMVPFAHLTWSSVWTGIAAGAVARAQEFIRHAARQSGGQLPPGAAHFTRAYASLRTLRGLVAASLRSFEQLQHDGQALRSIDFQTLINVTKVEASELAVSIVLSALRACGLSGYRNDSEFSVVRSLRDVLSAPIMINNDRILTNLATSSLMTGIPNSIQE